MITTDELKVQLAEYHTAVKDLEEALAIDHTSNSTANVTTDIIIYLACFIFLLIIIFVCILSPLIS